MMGRRSAVREIRAWVSKKRVQPLGGLYASMTLLTEWRGGVAATTSMRLLTEWRGGYDDVGYIQCVNVVISTTMRCVQRLQQHGS